MIREVQTDVPSEKREFQNMNITGFSVRQRKRVFGLHTAISIQFIV